VVLLSGFRSAPRETIRISGTGGAIGTMRILGAEFRKSNPGIRIDILSGMGSSGGVKAVLAGRLDIGLCARPLKDEERAQGAVETKYARTPYVFGVNPTLKMTGLTLEEVARIYSGERDWENNKRIRLILRPLHDSDTPVLKGMSPGMSAAIDVAVGREGMIFAMTDQEAADVLESVPGAFGGTTLSLFLSEKRKFRLISLNGVMPGLRTMANRSYPYSKTFFMITGKNPPDPVRRFIDFVRSPAGAAILAKNGQAALREGPPP
jgi:phosphate transport system substrate-binding protein